jgi:alpha-1,3-glucosyltransferase
MFIVWHIAEAFIEAPNHLPDIYTVINVLMSCGLFVLLFVYYVYRQFTITPFVTTVTEKKTQ